MMDFISVEGLRLPQIGLGTYPLRDDPLREALTAALSCGYSLIDTAFKYQNESEIGGFLSEKRFAKHQVIIQTKLSATQLSYKKFLGIKYGRETAEDAINGSLLRLQKKCLDVYLLHSPSNGYVDLYRELQFFKASGKANVIGVCKFDELQLHEINNKCGEYPSINQLEIHPFYTNKNVISFCKDNGIVIEARSVFAHGDIMRELFDSVDLQRIALEYNKSIPQVVLRWIVQQGLVAIVQSHSSEHIYDNIDIFDFELTEKQMMTIDSMNKNQSFGYKSISS